MRKPKPRDGTPERWLYVTLAIGIVVLVGFTGVGVWQWVTQRPTPTASPYPSAIPVTQVMVVYPTPFPTPLPAISSFEGSLVFSSVDGRLGMIGGRQEAFLPAPLLADQVTISS